MKQFDLKDSELLVVNTGDRFYCLEARCTHAGAPLAEGNLDGDILTCPWHYSQFRVSDGSVVRGPANSPLNIYDITVRDGQLFIEFKRKQEGLMVD
jgi:nitrite reductase/ring-hydroxylating ferredoxin subunit